MINNPSPLRGDYRGVEVMRFNPDHTPIRRKLRKDSTLPERILWSELRGMKTGYKFRRQETIGPYIVDYYCHAKKLIVEVDGIHHSDKDVEMNDRLRDEYFIENKFRILRFSDDEVKNNLEGVVIEIKKECERE
ncbi:MAG TPA: endonuclease domain-containing protein [bacterium]